MKQLRIDASLSKCRGVIFSHRRSEAVFERRDLALESGISRGEVFAHLAEMELSTLSDHGIRSRYEDAAANIADEVDKSRDLIVLLSRHVEIGRSSDRYKDERNGGYLHDT